MIDDVQLISTGKGKMTFRVRLNAFIVNEQGRVKRRSRLAEIPGIASNVGMGSYDDPAA